MRSRSSIAALIISTIYLSGCVGVDSGQPGESELRQSVLADCSSIPLMSAFSSIAVDPERELVIRDLHVVEDACRTTWTAAGCSTSLGAWTFGQLMATMSGNSDVTSPAAQNFVKQWLQFWLQP